MRKGKPDTPDFSPVRGKKLLIALSGGADSVALACLLSEAKDEFDLTLECAHMDHGIRPESPDDARFCEALCRSLGIVLHTVRMDIPQIARASGEGLETVARRERYAWLRRVREATGADHIALAHHLDDQAETVLMHLFRGTGPEGIVGMKPLSGDLYRPLLHMRKQAIVDYLRANGVSWREDATNLVDDNPRNALRLNVIPLIEQSYPRAVSAMGRYARSAAVESDLIARLADDYAREHLVHGPFGQLLKLSAGWEEAIVRRVIRKICPWADFDRLNDVLRLCASQRGRLDVSSGIMAERGRLGIYFLPKAPANTPEVPLCAQGVTRLEGLCAITASPCAPIPVKDDPLVQALRADALKGAVIRTRRDGDRIRPLGCGEKLLSDYFTDKKIDRPLRDCVPLVAVGNNILWAAGLGISRDAAIVSADDPCLRLECSENFNINQ